MRRPDMAVESLLWFGLLGAPLTWTLQFMAGFWIAETTCTVGGDRGLPVDAVVLAITAAAVAVAVLAELAAVKVFRDTRPVEGSGGSEEEAPKGRRHFLATVGVVITPLFTFIIVMSGIGVLVLTKCSQS